MKKNNGKFFIFLVIIISVVIKLLYFFIIEKLVAPDYAIEDRLELLKKNSLILDYQNFYWEYDYKSIASFDIKFSNGKTGVFNYAKLENGKIVFESFDHYDGYCIRGYKKYKDGRGVTDVFGYYKLFNFCTVEDVIENLSAIDKVIEEMPVINRGDIHREDFLQKLPDKVRYEDDEAEVIFYRVKSR